MESKIIIGLYLWIVPTLFLVLFYLLGYSIKPLDYIITAIMHFTGFLIILFDKEKGEGK